MISVIFCFLDALLDVLVINLRGAVLANEPVVVEVGAFGAGLAETRIVVVELQSLWALNSSLHSLQLISPVVDIREAGLIDRPVRVCEVRVMGNRRGTGFGQVIVVCTLHTLFLFQGEEQPLVANDAGAIGQQERCFRVAFLIGSVSFILVGSDLSFDGIKGVVRSLLEIVETFNGCHVAEGGQRIALVCCVVVVLARNTFSCPKVDGFLFCAA